MIAEVEAIARERMPLLDEVRRILIDVLGVRREAEEIDPDTPLFGTGLGLDSVDAVELLVAIELAFDVRIPDEWTRVAFRTVNSVVDTVLLLRAHE